MVLVRFAAAGRELIYLCLLFRTGGFCPLCKSRFRPSPHKIRLSYCRREVSARCPSVQVADAAVSLFPASAGSKGINTLDFPRESLVPRKALPSFGNLPPRGTMFPSGLPACPCSGYPSCSHTIDDPQPEQGKQALMPAPTLGRSQCLFFVNCGWNL